MRLGALLADDIAIYFYEMEGEKIKWEATAVFGPADVHKQVELKA